jgi:CelD/BcsL family acetyltransferase involved in cellulose biosynthesis
MPELEIITHPADFAALSPHWDALLASSAVAGSPFLSWDWVSLWWQHSQHRCSLRIGVLREGGELVAVAPFVLGHGQGRARRYLRHLSFIGGLGPIVSEGMDLIIPRGKEQLYAPLLLQMLEQTQWDVLDLPFLRSDSPSLLHIAAATSHLGVVEDRFPPVPSFRQNLDVAPEQIEKVLGSKSASQHRSRWKKLLTEHSARVLVAPADLPADTTFTEMLRLHSLRFDEQSSTFTLPEVEAFHRQLLQRWAPQGKAFILCVEAAGRISAARYCLLHQGVCYDFQGGYDPEFNDLSLGRATTLMAMAEALRRGATVYDHLPGDQEHKRRMHDHRHTYHHYEMFHPRQPLPLLFSAARGLKRMLRPQAAAAASTTPS